MFLHKPKYSVQIKVEKDEVFLNGSAEEADDTRIQGIMEVTSPSCYNSSSPVSIHLSLLCNLRIKSKDLFSLNHNQILFKLNWIFKCSITKDSNSLKFPFTAKLPGDLPASIDLDDLKISYQFKAYEEYPLLQCQYTIATKHISIHRLTRIPRPEYISTHANVPAAITKAKGQVGSDCYYSLSYPQICYSMENSIPVKLRLTLQPSQRVHSVIYSIRQSVNLGTLQQNNLGTKSEYQYQLTTQDAYTIPTISSGGCSPLNEVPTSSSSESGNSYISFKLTSELSPCQKNQKKFANYSSINYEFKVHHYILAQVTLIDISDQELRRETIRVPLTFLPMPKIDSSLPPAYEEAVSR